MTTEHEGSPMYDLCKTHMHAYVLLETSDGNKVDGIMTGLDQEFIYLAAPGAEDSGLDAQDNRESPEDTYRQFGGYGYGPNYYNQGPYYNQGQYYGGNDYGYGGGYGSGYGYPPRRFNRIILPLAALTALSVLPWY